MGQELAVIAIILLAAGYVGYRLFFKRNCGCDGCPMKKNATGSLDRVFAHKKSGCGCRCDK